MKKTKKLSKLHLCELDDTEMRAVNGGILLILAANIYLIYHSDEIVEGIKEGYNDATN